MSAYADASFVVSLYVPDANSDRAVAVNAAKALHDLEADAERGVFRILPVPASAWDIARRLSRKHTAKNGTRSLDILQVAAALTLKADAFLTFDRIQANLARAERLATPGSN